MSAWSAPSNADRRNNSGSCSFTEVLVVENDTAESCFLKRNMAEKKIRVMLVDDQVIVRRLLGELILEEPDMTIVGEASDGETAIRLVRELLPDVVLMDIQMPGMDGLKATQLIHKELPDVRIIGLSMYEEPEMASAMRTAGAVDYVTKSAPSNVAIAAIRASISSPPYSS
jgi:two-component system, NarL family, invasion response regulator UvrY